ncbi:MAG: restriction endonuclease subunit S [candidate division KSB1 bacterium]|nr:restriction endonuclease subunit S [candidate division KSB1 bacterium]MDZ7273114.1 restriction endonuclease subunit S [candidate division KSB1 bacterium]MDZ7285216.1 restriction endonuclease subunit S [candidate division KSB1 bacterium]MDZ7298248.1 restriction endonuclease subunit S [candidate division KSB1 bacterium]MDZ7308908.1 restriction endonuclease subunit S [candidate division KSB1 bacterium]
MADEWRETVLGQLMSFANGRSSPERADGLPYPVYGSNGVIGHAAEANADEGSIIIGRVGSYCGSLFFSKQRCWVTDNAIRATALGNNDARFLFYLLSTLDLNNWRAGSGQPLLNQDILSRIPASVPEPAEQLAIAHILGTLDDKIELNRRMSETLEAMARTLFKSWFVDFDPVRAKMDGRWRKGQTLPGLPAHLYELFPARLVPSELGEIPEGWVTGTLGDVAEHPRRSVRPSQINPEMPYIALEHMPKRCIALSDWATGDGLESNKFEFKRGEILFGKLRPYFHKVGVAPVDGVCSTDIVVVAPKDSRWFGFVLGHVSSREFVEYANAGSTGTKMPRTSWAEMARYEFALPPAPVAKAFTNVVRPSVDRIIASIHESRTLAALRDALLPKLISGELRVKDAERFLKKRGL